MSAFIRNLMSVGGIAMSVGGATWKLVEILDTRTQSVIQYVDKRHEEVKQSISELKSMNEKTQEMVQSILLEGFRAPAHSHGGRER